MNIITLDGVNDNMYPPQRKSYSVRFLQYLFILAFNSHAGVGVSFKTIDCKFDFVGDCIAKLIITLDIAEFNLFQVIRHFHDFDIDNYEWFLRVDDDVYLNFENLENLLQKLNPADRHMIGLPGFGRDPGEIITKKYFITKRSPEI